MLHLQWRKRPEPYPQEEKLWEQIFQDAEVCVLVNFLLRKLKMQFNMFKCSRNCEVQFMTSAWWKDTSFFNMIMHALIQHTWYWRKSKSLAGKCSPSSLQSKLAPSNYRCLGP
jgi:hypothetical protein